MKHQSRIRNITGLALGLQLLALLFLDGATSRLAATEPLQWLGNTWHWLADGASDPQEDLWIVPKAKHNTERAVAPAEFDRRLVDFFSPLAATRSSETESAIVAAR